MQILVEYLHIFFIIYAYTGDDLYLMDSAKGSGIGYELIDFIEDRMREAYMAIFNIYLRTKTSEI